MVLLVRPIHERAIAAIELRPVKHALPRGLFLAFLASSCSTSSGERPRDAAPTKRAEDTPPPAPAVDGKALLARAESARAAGDGTAVRSLLKQAAEDPATRPQAQLLLAELLFNEDGDAVNATPLAESAAKDAPSTSSLMLAGRIREAQSQRTAARTHYESAAKLDPKLVDAHERLGSIALADLAEATAQKNADAMKEAALRALVAFKEARTLAGDKPEYALGEAQALEATGDAAGAESALKRMIAMHPDAPGPHLLLANFYERHGDKTKAAAERKKAGQTPEPQKRKLRPLLPSR